MGEDGLSPISPGWHRVSRWPGVAVVFKRGGTPGSFGAPQDKKIAHGGDNVARLDKRLIIKAFIKQERPAGEGGP